MPRILMQFSRLGPYHIARIEAAKKALQELGIVLITLETAGTDQTYAWSEETSCGASWERVTVFPGRVYDGIPVDEMRVQIRRKLDELKPDAIAIAGWSAPDARACLAWCRRHRKRAILMSETRHADGKRVWWKEWVKRRLVAQFDAALVGGASHRAYLMGLGMKPDKISCGYDVVDNAHFRSEGKRWWERGEIADDRPNFFLASNRFVERKNLHRLVGAYKAYAEAVQAHGESVWHLCLLGDGALKGVLREQCEALGLHVVEAAPWECPLGGPGPLPTVYFPGFRQIEELPRFYAHAACFIHPALQEPWGLVLNEAMASGLPVLSSQHVGAAEELVEEGRNGWTFDPHDTDAMAGAMYTMATLEEATRAEMGEASSRLVEEKCPTSAFGQGLASALVAAGMNSVGLP